LKPATQPLKPAINFLFFLKLSSPLPINTL
jgi:hypothetical protein